MSFINIDKKTFWQIINIGLIGMLVGGMATVVIADFVETPAPAAIGQLSSPDSIQTGMWFRYDPNKSWADMMHTYANWSLTGGYPYVIVECINKTTFENLGDPAAIDGPSKPTYQWKVTPYWENGAEAAELENGSIVNDIWELCFKQVWTGQYPIVKGSPTERARWWIDPTLSNWSTQINFNFESYKRAFIANQGGITDVTEAIYFITYWDAVVYKFNRQANIHCGYDADTHLLAYALISDTWGTTAGQFMSFCLTGYSDGVNIAGKTPPSPAPVVPRISRVYGKPYEYQLDLLGPFTTVNITIISNDSSAFVNVDNSFSTTKASIPIDISAPVHAVFVMEGELNGLPMATVNVSVVLDYVNFGSKPSVVTLSFITNVGNSFTASWTSSPVANAYWVMVNETFLMSSVSTTATFQLAKGSWNITVIVIDTASNETSDQSNGIIVLSTVVSTSPTEYANDPNRTDISPAPTNTMIIIIVILVIIGAVTLLLVYMVMTGRIRMTPKLASKQTGRVGTISRKK